MNFDFSDDLKALREEARKFLRDKCPPGLTRRLLESGEPYDATLWREIGALGWVGASIPEEYGGVGLGHLAVCVLAEELGRAVAPVPFGSSVYFAAESILCFGTPAQKKEWLPKLASGEIVGTLALAERLGAVDPAKLQARAAGGRVSGAKIAVPDGMSADIVVVATAASDSAPALHIVEPGVAGVRRELVDSFDPSRPQARMTFDNAAADPLPGAKGSSAVRRLMDRAAVMMAFEQVGGAQAALEMARDYALNRYAFGRPIGSFQAIKHKLADVYVAVELARSNAYYGAWALHTDAAALPLAAAVARVAASDAGWLAAKENIQTHGGMGYTWDGDCHLIYRRAKGLGVALGGAREWKRRMISELRAGNAAHELPA
jgi:acyl-CoA dehydrogenase